MIGLIDCNNFFVSCERVFNPSIREKPVIVFSNNDGCAVAISNEAKALGIKRGDPYFKIKGICNRYGISTFSGNHKLYGDMSARVMAVISETIPEIEIYSIDEAFLHLDGIETSSLEDFGRNIVRRVRRNTGIPTSLGIAPTKTLAKIAARFAKKYPAYRGCCIIDNDDKRRKALALTAVNDVWGIGRRISRRLGDYGVTTALQFAEWTQENVTQLFHLNGEKTWMELNGHACISFEQEESSKKQMMSSRSFGKAVTDINDLKSAIASFVNNLGRKMRANNQAAVSLTVYIHTDSFRPDQPQYFNTAHRTLPEPTADTMTLTAVACDALCSIYRKDYAYKKAGVMINELTDSRHIQQSLFCNTTDRERRSRLMAAMDSINSGSLSHDTIHTASYSPIDKLVRKDHPSRLFSTRLSDIISINCIHGS